jgi:uncharacterized YccA/Bax inhibitor family protein
MTNTTLFCAIALLGVGIAAYVQSGTDNKAAADKATAAARETDPKADALAPKKVSMTTLIPAGVGVALLACVAGVIYLPKARKHIMHVAAMIGLIGFIGGFVPIFRSETGFSFENPAIRTGLLMSLICGVFVGLCVKSFIDARKARIAGSPAVA